MRGILFRKKSMNFYLSDSSSGDWMLDYESKQGSRMDRAGGGE